MIRHFNYRGKSLIYDCRILLKLLPTHYSHVYNYTKQRFIRFDDILYTPEHSSPRIRRRLISQQMSNGFFYSIKPVRFELRTAFLEAF